MKQHTKLSQKPEHVAEQQTPTAAAKEFSNSDELLRYDAAQTPVPPELAERLKRSSDADAPTPKPSWLKRLFGGSNL